MYDLLETGCVGIGWDCECIWLLLALALSLGLWVYLPSVDIGLPWPQFSGPIHLFLGFGFVDVFAIYVFIHVTLDN